MSGWHRHRDRAAPLTTDKTREERGLLPGQKRGPTPGHQWGLSHGHVHMVRRWMPAVRMSNLDDVQAWRRTGAKGTVEVRLAPGEDKRMTIRQVPGAILP